MNASLISLGILRKPFWKYFCESILDITLSWDMYIHQDQPGSILHDSS